jgi:hypothetical protein
MPRQEAGVSGYRVLAISAGTVVGLIAANYLTAGMITPILAAGTEVGMPGMAAAAAAPVEAAGAAAAAPAAEAVAAVGAAPAAAAAAPAAAVEAAAAPAAAAPGMMEQVGWGLHAARAATLVAGAAIGGYVGNWIYGK